MIIAIDNGTSGSIAFLNRDGSIHKVFKTPSKNVRDYTKKENWITRLDHFAFRNLFMGLGTETVVMERPIKNGRLFTTSVSSNRCFEAQIVCLEQSGIEYIVIDSGEWQKVMLPGVKGRKELKKAAEMKALTLWPEYDTIRREQKIDADGLLIAEWYRTRVPDISR